MGRLKEGSDTVENMTIINGQHGISYLPMMTKWCQWSFWHHREENIVGTKPPQLLEARLKHHLEEIKRNFILTQLFIRPNLVS
jgi:hypothetical protein